MNTEFQRRARKDNKVFLSDQFKEIEENNRMGKTRDLFKKTRESKGKFHAKISSVKDRNGIDLTESDDIKERYDLGKNTQKNCAKKVLRSWITMMVWSLN